MSPRLVCALRRRGIPMPDLVGDRRDMRSAWALAAAVACIGCAAPSPNTTATGSAEPPLRVPDALKCHRDEGPLPAKAWNNAEIAESWPGIVDKHPSKEVRDRLMAEGKQANDLLDAHRCDEACTLYRKELRESMDVGYSYAQRIPRGAMQCCAEGWSELLMVQVPFRTCSVTDRGWGPPRSPRFSLDYLVGLAWFRLGSYADARTCFEWVDRNSDWLEAAHDCWLLTKEFEEAQKAGTVTHPTPSGVPTEIPDE